LETFKTGPMRYLSVHQFIMQAILFIRRQ